MGNDTLEKWLRLYVEQLDRVLRDGMQILSDANQLTIDRIMYMVI